MLGSDSEGKGACLDDPPTLGGYQYPDLPAGSMYSAEHQCRLQFGTEEAGVCSDMEEVSNQSGRQEVALLPKSGC